MWERGKLFLFVSIQGKTLNHKFFSWRISYKADLRTVISCHLSVFIHMTDFIKSLLKELDKEQEF